MDVDLREVLQTLAVGAFLIASIEVLCHYMFGVTLNKSLPLNTHLHPWGFNALVIATAFIGGLVCEGVSKGLMQKVRGSYPTFLEPVRKWFLPSEDELRVEKLFARRGEGLFEVTLLAQELHEGGAFLAASPTTNQCVQNRISRAKACRTDPSAPLLISADQKEVRRVALSVFYLGHNRLYTEGMALQELGEMEKRINFGRSFAFAAVSLSLLAGVCGLGPRALVWAEGTIMRRAPGVALWNAAVNLQLLSSVMQPYVKRRKPLVLLCVFFAFAYGSARVVFYCEHDGYNIRVLGYLSTLQKTRHNMPVPAAVPAAGPAGLGGP